MKNYSISFCAILIGLFSFRLFFFPAQVLANDLRHYDFTQAIKFIDQNIEKPRIYTEYNNGMIHLGERAVVQGGFFNYYQPTAAIRAQKDDMIARIQSEFPVNGILILGSNCKVLKVKKDFAPILTGIDHLAYEKGKICVFTRSEGQ